MDEESDEDQEEINHGGKSHQEDKARQRAGDILQDSGQILSLNASQHRTPNEEGENYEAGDVFNGKTIHAVLDDRDVSNFTIGDACAALLSANTAFEEDVPELPPSGMWPTCIVHFSLALPFHLQVLFLPSSSRITNRTGRQGVSQATNLRLQEHSGRSSYAKYFCLWQLFQLFREIKNCGKGMGHTLLCMWFMKAWRSELGVS